MNVEIRHNNTNITDRVIQYSREHQICTGIGRLQIVIEGTYLTSINPHDDIKIYENGDFKVKYYVSDVDRSAPDGTIRLECQDGSKYLVDYFIPESYTIDYPSYTRYWIELFLDQAGINYEFTTDSPGNLLSNYTQLGLQPAYDQIMMLCQLSGWYFYFDGNGKVIIGSLTTDLSSGGSIGKTDILEIKKITDDKMLRNRAVVWGQYDPIRQEYAYADVSKHTSWNYDHDDLRTMVISNNNIPNRSSAYSIANLLLKEFAKVTIEKHIRVHGARDFNLGETLRVDSHVWRGKGLITTFGVSVDRAGGLITNVILDERCPRLFGFFDFGDYVYVGTFGDGVWRKHIKFDPTWYNFSTGLTDLNITDLHINNGVFGSVAHSGSMYISPSEEGPWSQVSVTSLLSTSQDYTSSGIINYDTEFSGIMGRAVIVDKSSNNVKFGVDNWSGLNYGDYFLMYSGMNPVFNLSGFTFTGPSLSGSQRGWILEYDPFTMGLVADYPVHWSGNYDLIVLDLENDGRNDYVSIRLGGSVGSDMGRHQNMPYAQAHDLNTVVQVPFSGVINVLRVSAKVVNENSLITLSDTLDREHIAFFQEVIPDVEPVEYRLNETRFVRVQNEETGEFEVDVEQVASASMGTDQAMTVVHIGGTLYAVYYKRTSVAGDEITYYRRLWNSLLPETIGAEEEIYELDIRKVARGITGDQSFRVKSQHLVVNNILYDMILNWYPANSVGSLAMEPSFAFITMVQISLLGASGSSADIFEYETEQHDSFPGEEYRGLPSTNTSPDGPLAAMFRNGESIQIVGWMPEDYAHPFNPVDQYTQVRDWFLSGGVNGVGKTKIYEAENSPTIDLVNNEPVVMMFERGQMDDLAAGYTQSRVRQLNYNSALVVADQDEASDFGYYGFYSDGSELFPVSSRIQDTFYRSIDKIFPLYAGNQFYIARESAGAYWLCSAGSIAPLFQITAPAGWELIKPLSMPDSFNSSEFYWILRNDSDSMYYLVPATTTQFFTNRAVMLDIGFSLTENNLPAMIQGHFLITDVNWVTTAAGQGQTVNILYLDLNNVGGYMVLKREGEDFNLIQRASKPIRIDISNSSPLLTAQDVESTFKSYFIYDDQASEISPFTTTSGLVTNIRDYRYALLETLSGVIVASGSPVTSQVLEATWSGIYTSDVSTYSGGFILWKEIPSGFAERIETTNYVYPGQYVFVTTSGDNPSFFQKDNDSMFFDSYSGLPDSRATIIRVDDRL